MARNPTALTWQALTAQYTTDAFIALLRISYWDDANQNYDCVFICNNSTDIRSSADGEEHIYISFPVGIIAPTDESGGLSKATLTITNVSQELIDQIRTTPKPMIVDIGVINSAEPDVLIAKWPHYIWRNLSYDVNAISGQISMENFVSEPYPGDRFTPATTPGLFQ